MTERHTALYRLLSKSGRLLYVGISGNPDSRWGTHSNNQPWWEEVADRKIEWFGSREAASAAEVEAIKEEQTLASKLSEGRYAFGETNPHLVEVNWASKVARTHYLSRFDEAVGKYFVHSKNFNVQSIIAELRKIFEEGK